MMSESEEKSKVAKPAPGGKEHPEIAKMKARMFDLTTRGKSLTLQQKYLVLIATTTAQGYALEATKFTYAALNAGISPAAIKETAMQSIPFAGFKPLEAVLPGLVNALIETGVHFPMPPNGVVTDENRMQEGLKAQVSLIGESVVDWQKSLPEDEKSILQDDLTEWCFGEFFTRTGLTLQERELVTFAILVALPDCETELATHIKANLNIGTTRQVLLGAIQVALPLNGLPRTINALKVLDKIAVPS